MKGSQGIWGFMQAQFLDRHHLLIALRTQDPDMARNMDVTPHPAFYVVYDTANSVIRKVTDKNDAGVVQAYLRHAPMFHAADVTSEWGRCVTPAVVGLHPPEEQMGLASRQWNGVLPVCPSSCCIILLVPTVTVTTPLQIPPYSMWFFVMHSEGKHNTPTSSLMVSVVQFAVSQVEGNAEPHNCCFACSKLLSYSKSTCIDLCS